MTDKEFALITVTVSSVFGVLVSYLTAVLTARRENRVYKREQLQKKVEAIRSLYEDALFLLDRHLRKGGVGKEEHYYDMIRLSARLAITSTPEIRDQYDKTTEALDEWAAEYRKGQPERIGDTLLYKSWATPHQEKANLLYPEVFTQYKKLEELMRQHLEKIEAQQ